MNWYGRQPECIEIEYTLAPHREQILKIVLHGFDNAGGVSAVVYTVVRQVRGTNQGLVCANSWLVKRNLTLALSWWLVTCQSIWGLMLS